MGTHQYTFLSSDIPPIPLLSVQLKTPGLQPRKSINAQAILDTGSDCTLVPLPLLMQVKARIIGRSIRVPIAGHNAIAIPHAIGLHFDQYSHTGLEVFGCSIEDIGELLIIGRDLMNLYRIEFDGQSSAFTIF